MKTPILIIADDLTGAADSAGQFRQAGFSALVLARPAKHQARLRGAQVVSLSLNTRDASAAAVRRIWERQAPTIRRLAQGALVYQKIDSTLRGHPGLEVRLLLDCLGASAAIIAPAFPKLGRHTIDGVHRVHGVPLADTEYARTQTRTRATSHLAELLASHDDERPVHLPWQVIDRGVDVVAPWLQERLDESCQLITADAADERHLDILTQAVLPMVGKVLMVGSAGWAERLAIAYKGLMTDTPAGPGVLGVVGSLSAIATRQVQVASQAGVRVVQIPLSITHAMAGETAGDWQALTQALSRPLDPPRRSAHRRASRRATCVALPRSHRARAAVRNAGEWAGACRRRYGRGHLACTARLWTDARRGGGTRAAVWPTVGWPFCGIASGYQGGRIWGRHSAGGWPEVPAEPDRSIEFIRGASLDVGKP